jgi:hypothetical protein
MVAGSTKADPGAMRFRTAGLAQWTLDKKQPHSVEQPLAKVRSSSEPSRWVGSGQ